MDKGELAVPETGILKHLLGPVGEVRPDLHVGIGVPLPPVSRALEALGERDLQPDRQRLIISGGRPPDVLEPPIQMVDRIIPVLVPNRSEQHGRQPGAHDELVPDLRSVLAIYSGRLLVDLVLCFRALHAFRARFLVPGYPEFLVLRLIFSCSVHLRTAQFFRTARIRTPWIRVVVAENAECLVAADPDFLCDGQPTG